MPLPVVLLLCFSHARKPKPAAFSRAAPSTAPFFAVPFRPVPQDDSQKRNRSSVGDGLCCSRWVSILHPPRHSANPRKRVRHDLAPKPSSPSRRQNPLPPLELTSPSRITGRPGWFVGLLVARTGSLFPHPLHSRLSRCAFALHGLAHLFRADVVLPPDAGTGGLAFRSLRSRLLPPLLRGPLA